MKEYFKIIGLSLIPTFLVFIGRNETFFAKLKSLNIIRPDANVESIQFYCFVIGIFFAGLIIPSQLAQQKNKVKALEGNQEGTLKYLKDVILKTVSLEIANQEADLKTRIFVPKKGFVPWLNRKVKDEIILVPKHVKGLTDEISARGLQFKVGKVIEGMVGKCFKEKKIIVDDSVATSTAYTLSESQKMKVRKVKFCATIPILNYADNVVAILSIDSDDVLKLNDAQEDVFKNHFINYAIFIENNINLQ